MKAAGLLAHAGHKPKYLTGGNEAQGCKHVTASLRPLGELTTEYLSESRLCQSAVSSPPASPRQCRRAPTADVRQGPVSPRCNAPGGDTDGAHTRVIAISFLVTWAWALCLQI